MTTEEIYQIARDRLGFEPIPSQEEALKALCRFAAERGPADVFILNGYAGTGKTSVTAALVRALVELKKQVVILAPTGRAAKVASRMAGVEASTIHRRIYHPVGNGPETQIQLSPNRARDAIFIVDEASLITDTEGSRSVLTHLVNHIYRFGDSCGMILVGDRAQLPPVGQDDSPAMNHSRLRALGLNPKEVTLDVPIRQAAESGVLHNATIVRQALMDAMKKNEAEKRTETSAADILSKIPGLKMGLGGQGGLIHGPAAPQSTPPASQSLREMPSGPVEPPKLELAGFEDIQAVSSADLADALTDSWNTVGAEETLIITRSNSRANKFNMAIRNLVMYAEDPLQPGDRLVISKNDYFWKARNNQKGFVSNGDIAVVNWIGKMEKMYGRYFAEVELFFPADQSLMGVKLMMRSLMAEGPSIPRAEMARFYQTVCEEQEGGSNEKAMAALNDPYYNAIQAKYAYCVTCHKAQGGQWRHVYIDMGNILRESMDASFLRWLYTAMTRTTDKLFLINPTIPTDLDD